MNKRYLSAKSKEHQKRACLLGLSIVLLSGVALSDTPATSAGVLSATYEIVTVRNASDVASTANALDEADSPIGETISFTVDGLSMSGLACDSWEISELAEAVVNLNDPLIADVNIESIDSEISAGDQRVMKSYAYDCEGESFLKVLQVDDRVIVIPWANSSKYLIAEIPLSFDQVTQLQKELKSMKFFDGELTGLIDEPTQIALGSWASYRSPNPDAYQFQRTALTENLLDALGVLEISGSE